MRVSAVGDPWTVADLGGWAGEGLGEATWVQVGALLRTDFGAGTLEVLARGRSLLLDAQGLARVARVGPLVRDTGVDASCFRHVAVLKLNEDEAQILSGGTDASSVRRIGVSEVIVTRGTSGTEVVTDRYAEHVEPREVVRSADPTGAGDLFGAAYLARRAGGGEPVDAARAAGDVVSDVLARR